MADMSDASIGVIEWRIRLQDSMADPQGMQAAIVRIKIDYYSFSLYRDGELTLTCEFKGDHFRAVCTSYATAQELRSLHNDLGCFLCGSIDRFFFRDVDYSCILAFYQESKWIRFMCELSVCGTLKPSFVRIGEEKWAANDFWKSPWTQQPLGARMFIGSGIVDRDEMNRVRRVIAEILARNGW